MDYYDILGVSEEASDAEIKAAFKARARAFHPDKHNGDPEMEERFKEVNLAYQVLKNPYEKARYDLRRNFGPVQYEHTYQQPPRKDYTPYNYAESDRPTFNYRENWIATGYAFGFTLIMALLVMFGIHLKGKYDQRQKEEMLAARRATFQMARENHKNGQIKEAIDLMNGLGGFFSSEEELETFKDQLIEETIAKGNQFFTEGKYYKSIYYLEILDGFNELPALSLKEKLSICYSRTGQPTKAIRELKELMEDGYRDLFIFTQLGKVYLEQQNDTVNALFYYEKARDLTIAYYESVYGKAYPITIKINSLPTDHLDIYMRLGTIYLEQDRYEEAVQLAEWIKRVWPYEAEAYYLSGKAFAGLRNFKKACENLVEASLLGMSMDLPANCR